MQFSSMAYSFTQTRQEVLSDEESHELFDQQLGVVIDTSIGERCP